MLCVCAKALIEAGAVRALVGYIHAASTVLTAHAGAVTMAVWGLHRLLVSALRILHQVFCSFLFKYKVDSYVLV